MATLDARVRRLEAAGSAPVSALTAAQRATLSAEVRALLALVPDEDDRAELMRRIDGGEATECDRARLAGCSMDTLRTVVAVSSEWA